MAGGGLWQGQWGPAVGSAVVLVVLPSTLPAGPQCRPRDGGGFPIPGSTQQGKDPNLCFPGFPKTLKEPNLYMTPFLTLALFLSLWGLLTVHSSGGLCCKVHCGRVREGAEAGPKEGRKASGEVIPESW